MQEAKEIAPKHGRYRRSCLARWPDSIAPHWLIENGGLHNDTAMATSVGSDDWEHSYDKYWDYNPYGVDLDEEELPDKLDSLMLTSLLPSASASASASVIMTSSSAARQDAFMTTLLGALALLYMCV